MYLVWILSRCLRCFHSFATIIHHDHDNETMMKQSCSPDPALWKDVCLASAWFHRAQTTLRSSSSSIVNSSNCSGSNNDDEKIAEPTASVTVAIAAAERALSLYQSCHKCVKKRRRVREGASSTASSASAPVSDVNGIGNDAPLLDSSSKSKCLDSNKSNAATAASFTINLELRMAQTLRFLALIHATTAVSSAAADTNSRAVSDPSREDGNEHAHHLGTAIKYHDMAVSLLVGVFDEEEEGEDGESNNDNNQDDMNNINIECREDTPQEQTRQHQGDQQQQQLTDAAGELDMDIWSQETFSEQSPDDSDINNNDRTMLTICVPNDARLEKHTLSQNCNPNINNAQDASASAATTTEASFLFPTEDQRVRAIAVSLNALAELHAVCGDDRAAMDSYREALEILRAATEEVEGEEEEEEEDEADEDMVLAEGENDEIGGLSGEGTPLQTRLNKTSSSFASTNNKQKNTILSPIQSDLANTLLNVGNFHLRRDELDAALNAYSTVWALHSGNSLDQHNDEHAEEAGAATDIVPSTPTSCSIGGSASVSVSLPYLNTPSSSTAQSMLKTLSNTNTPVSNSQSSPATPNNAAATPAYSSPGALIALNNLGIVHERRGELPEALACFEHVHHARLELLAEQGGDHNANSVNVLINIGNCHQRLANWERACVAYEEAVRAYRKLLRYKHTSSMDADDGKGLGDDNFVRGDSTNNARIEDLKLHRSLSGALRNWGTCYWKRRRVSDAIDKLNEAVDVEERIVSLSQEYYTCGVGATALDYVRQAKESMAQLLGLLGCLYLEYKLDELKSYRKSEEAFQVAVRLYDELGYNASHPSVVWARHNLVAVGRARDHPPPPPPHPARPLTPPCGQCNIATEATANNHEDIVDLDDIDSVELDAILAPDDEKNGGDEDEDDDDIFEGVDANSTDELDDFLSREGAPRPPPKTEPAVIGEEKASFQDEVCFDTPEIASEAVVKSDSKQSPVEEKPPQDGTAIKPLSMKHRNISSSLFSDQGDEARQRKQQEEEAMNERLSQLQLQTAGSNEGGDTVEAAHAHIKLAEHFWQKGDRVAATEHYTEAHSIFASHFGDSSMEVAMVLKKLGDLNQEDGTLDAAKELYMEALEMELEVHGQYLPQTLNAAGACCLQQDDFRSAMEFHRRALQIQKKSQGREEGGQNKYDMYETLVRIGNVYYSERNDFTNIRSKRDYREFIESGFLGWIANAHDMRGEYMKSVQFYEESLQLVLSRKGKDAKRETALTLNRLGSLTRELGRYDEAMDYHQKALNIQRSGSGVAKAMTAETCVLMGMVKSKMGEFQGALDLFEDSLLVLKSALGEDHLSVSKTMAQIGSVHFEMSKFDQAMKMLLEAERCQLAFVGEKNRDTLETQALIGRVLSATGKFEEALEKLKGVAECQNSLFGLKHPAIADTLMYLGECFLEQGLATEARGQFVDCYNMRKNFFTVDQIHIAESMVDIIRSRNGQPERALAIYKNAGLVFEEYLRDDHVQIGRLRVYEGDSYAELLNFSSAIQRYEQAKEIFSKVFGGECTLDSALVAVNIGKVLLRKCDYDAAKTSFTSALNIYEQILPEGHQKITSTLNNLDRVEQEEALCV